MFSNVNKQFVVFLFFLFLSGIFWLIMTLNETYERDIKIPLRITNIPKKHLRYLPDEECEDTAS